MTNQMTAKLRLVRCPRCRQLLQEPADIPVYKCGGCGTVLQAKKQKNDTKDEGSCLQETDPSQKNENELEHVAENKEAGGLNQQAILPSKGESALDKNNGRDQYESGECNGEQPGGIILSDEPSSSTKRTCHENEESSPEARAHVEVDEDKCSLDKKNGRDQNEFGDCNRDLSGGIILSDEPSLSTKLTCHENEESSPEARDHMEVDEDKCSLDKKNGRDQNEFGDCNGEQPGGIILSDEPSSSTKLTCHENEESSPEARDHMEADEDECSLDKKNGSDQNEFGDCNSEWSGGIILSDGVSSSTELTCHENEESSPEARDHMEVEEDKFSLDWKNGTDQNEFGDYNREQPGGINFSDEVCSSTELNCHENELSPIATAHIELDENKYSLEQSNGRDHNDSGDCNGEWPGKINDSIEIPSSTELTCHEIEEPSPESGEDENFRTRFFFRSSSAENLLATRPRDSIFTAQRPLDESISSDNLMSPYNEQLEQSQKSVLHRSDRVSSVDTLENTLVNPSSELSGTLRDMSKSPTTRSFYAYDGSVSSYDGTDDQVHDRHLHLSERNFKDADFTSIKGIPRRNEFMVSGMMSSDLEMQHQAGNSSSISSEKKHYAMKSSNWHRDELLEPTRYGHPVGRRMRLETDERLSRLPFYSRGSQADNGNGGPSRYRHDEFQCRSGFHSPGKPKYSEHDKMELVRMVYELQDQLNRTHISKRKANGRFPAGVARKEKQIPLYYDHVSPDMEINHDLNYPRYTGRCSQGKSWSQQCKVSLMPFSGEVTDNRHQVDYSCLHCCPQDWHCSAQLPPHVCCNKGQYTAHPSHKCYNCYRSGPSSPQHYMDSKFPLWSHDMKSDNQWHKDHEVKHLRERPHSVKRHFRPIAGGAPIIACYHCLELLQLPADFLLFRRTCHRLKCSACSKVLKFSLQNRINIVPYTPDIIAPPPSEIDGHSNAISSRWLASESRSNNCPHADPVSCSDHYGSSFCRSCSTEGEPSSLIPPFHILERNPNNRKMSSSSSFEPMEERKKKPVLRQSQNKNKNPVETFESAGPSWNTSKPDKFSEIEELPPATGSPLHRLMGYCSPSEVINGSGVGTSSHYPEKGLKSRD